MTSFAAPKQIAVSPRLQTSLSGNRARAANDTLNPVGSRQKAIEYIYDRHVEQIYRFVYYKVGNREDAEDITSQVFFKASNSLDVTQEPAAQLAWLYQVARTTITDYWRSYYKGPTTSLDLLQEKTSLHLTAEPLKVGGEVEDEAPASMSKVLSILNRLPHNYRRVLELRFLEGLSLKETAEAMGVSEGNVKVLQHRALHKAVKIESVAA